MNTIDRWYGGFGNNILQISNALTSSFFERRKYVSPRHPFISSFEVEFGSDFAMPGTYFYLDLLKFGDLSSVLEVREGLVKEFLVPNLLLSKLDLQTEKQIKNEKNLVIHIRGGDIFQPHHVPVHSDYVQAPLRYYEFVAEQFDSIYIINQDNKNPVLTTLLRNSKFEILAKSLQYDASVLMNSVNLGVGGAGTFVLSCLLCSSSVQKIYLPNFAEDVWKNNFSKAEKITLVNLPNFIRP